MNLLLAGSWGIRSRSWRDKHSFLSPRLAAHIEPEALVSEQWRSHRSLLTRQVPDPRRA